MARTHAVVVMKDERKTEGIKKEKRKGLTLCQPASPRQGATIYDRHRKGLVVVVASRTTGDDDENRTTVIVSDVDDAFSALTLVVNRKDVKRVVRARTDGPSASIYLKPL